MISFFDGYLISCHWFLQANNFPFLNYFTLLFCNNNPLVVWKKKIFLNKSFFHWLFRSCRLVSHKHPSQCRNGAVTAPWLSRSNSSETTIESRYLAASVGRSATQWIWQVAGVFFSDFYPGFFFFFFSWDYWDCSQSAQHGSDSKIWLWILQNRYQFLAISISL